MTPAEAVLAVRKKGHVVIIHRESVFFNTSDEAEALKWDDMGATIVPHFNDIEIQTRLKKGRRVTQGWEVHFLGACERIEMEDTDGDLVDLTKDHLLAAARDKVLA